MLAIKIDAATAERLDAAARRLGEAPDAVAAKALLTYLEDLEDYARAADAVSECDEAGVVSLAQMKSELGLDA